MNQVSWALYKSELATPTPVENRLGRPHEALQLTGYWRIEAAKTKPDWPVLIWTEADEAKNPTGATIFQIGNKVQNTIEHEAEWDDFTNSSWFKCRAVSREDYSVAMTTGFWPDDHKPARQMTEDEKLGIDTAPGSNNAPIDETLAEQIAALAEKAAAAQVKDQATADAATGILDRLRVLLKKAEAERVAEKEPHLQAGRDVDAKWSGIRQPGLSAGEDLEKRRKAWLRIEQQRLDDEAAAERERLRKEAEAQRIQAEKDAKAKGVEALPPEPIPEPVVETKRAVAGTAHGRATGLKKVPKAVVIDPPALCNHFLDTRNPDADFAAYLLERAQKAARAKITLPGVRIDEVLE